VALLIPSAAIAMSASRSPARRRAPNHPVPDLHRHVVPASRGHDVPQRVRVRGRQVPLGSGRQAYPEAEGRPRFTLLINDHVARRACELEQARGVQPARAATEHPDSP